MSLQQLRRLVLVQVQLLGLWNKRYQYAFHFEMKSQTGYFSCTYQKRDISRSNLNRLLLDLCLHLLRLRRALLR